MKLLIGFVVVVLVAPYIGAQTTINHNPSLYAVGAEYTNRTVQSAYFVPGPPGNGYWDFTGFTDGAENTFQNVAYSASIPHIGECAVIPNYIPYYHRITDTTETEGWGFSYVTTTYIDGLGLYGWHQKEGESRMELTTFHDSYTHSHTWPIDYLDSWVEITSGSGVMIWGVIEIDYTYQDTAYKKIDGFGTVVTPLGTFQALRMKKRHTQHTHSDHWLFGFDKLKRDFSYNWHTTEAGVVASFTGPTDSTGGRPDSTFTTGNINVQIYNSEVGIQEAVIIPEAFSMEVYPNPFNAAITIEIASRAALHATVVQVEIYDVKGRSVCTFGGEEGGLITDYWSLTNQEDWLGEFDSQTSQITHFTWQPSPTNPSGIYLIKAAFNNQCITKRVVYLK